MRYDALIIGSGIGGMESALKLGDMGYRVLVVEKEASVGGKMILLSKVFPTLDCASCISTPKMAATVHHPNVTVLTYAQVKTITGDGDGLLRAAIHQRPRYVDEAACTGCQQCEMACTVAVPDEFNADLVGRRAVHIPFPQAVPKKAVVQRAGTSPCTFTCPAGIKAHGYVSLVRAGEYDKAFDLILETTPLVGSLGRACYAPCESECGRGALEGPVPIRRIKRFVADTRYAARRSGAGPLAPPADPGPPSPPSPAGPPGPAGAADAAEAVGARVAVVGSGPAGLTAAWHLARRGHRVTVLEAAARPGGMLRLGIPAYRLPHQVVDDDIANLTAIGVRIETGRRVTDLTELADQGYAAVLLATGTHAPGRLRVPGEDLPGVVPALTLLREAKQDNHDPLSATVRGHHVVVVGGGNVAVDAARTARRLGAARVYLVSLEARAGLPAYAWEVDEALAEGVTLHDSWGVREVRGENHGAGERVTGVTLRRCLSVLDPAGRFAPSYDEETTLRLDCDVVVTAVGMGPNTGDFANVVPVNRNRTVAVDPRTLQTSVPHIFAAGDTVTGPSMITKAVGQGRRAAYMMDRWLRGEPLDGGALDGGALEPVLDRADLTEVLARQRHYSRREPVTVPSWDGGAVGFADGGAVGFADGSGRGFAEVEPALTEEQARYSATRCLDCGVCSECHECLSVCPAGAIDLDARPRDIEAEVGAVVLATGFTLFPADAKPQYGYGRYRNVITGTQMDRLLAPTRPYHTVLRPGDGKVPERIAYVMCTGSRDQTVGNPSCSKICCMYSVKQNQLIMGALPLADVTVHYLDIRSVGKGYDEFYEQARAMGATYIRGRVARIEEKADGDLILHYEDVENGDAPATAEYDLVVLAVGVRPNPEAAGLFPGSALALDDQAYVAEPVLLDPGTTSLPGVFVAGTAAGPKDIPESILHAGAAVAQVAARLERLRAGTDREVPV